MIKGKGQFASQNSNSPGFTLSGHSLQSSDNLTPSLISYKNIGLLNYWWTNESKQKDRPFLIKKFQSIGTKPIVVKFCNQCIKVSKC